MRNPNLTAWVAGLVIALAACGGASSGEVKSANRAHYTGDKMQIFQAMKAAVAEKYKIEKTEEANLVLKTTGRWYTPEGLAASERMDDIRDVPDNSIHIAYFVKLLEDNGSYVVDIKPEMYRLHAGSPAPEPLTEDDISVPGWAHGKKDALVVAIHDALKSFEVQSVPQMTPAGAPPGATPATGTGAGSAAGAGTGSAAGTGAGAGSAAGTGSAAGSAAPAP